MKTIEELDIQSRPTFIRVDFNVPLTEDGKVRDDTRINAALPTIKLALEKGAKVALASHLGRPKGQVKKEYSLEPVGQRLAELLNCEVIFADNCIGDGVKGLMRELQPNQILLLENLRFHNGETDNDPEFARALAEPFEVYINDAFGTAHRAHASTAGVPALRKDKGSGLLMKKEIDGLSPLLKNPKEPYVAVLGGAKVSDKIQVLRSLMDRVDTMIIGGAMAYTFLKAKGIDIGKSRLDADHLKETSELLKNAATRGIEILLPMDHYAAIEFSKDATKKLIDGYALPDDVMGLDIGPKTVSKYTEAISQANTIFWNGPMGVFEWENYAQGTMAVATAIAENKGYTVIGGGDSVAAVSQAGVKEKISHVSTGGGASLEFVQGITLPGLEALEG